MNPSDVDVIAQEKNPAQGTFQKLRYCYRAIHSGNWGSALTDDEAGVPCIRIGDFDDTTLRLKRQERVLRGQGGGKVRTLPIPTLLLERAGGDARTSVGRVVLYDRDEGATISNFIVEMQPKSTMDARFLLFSHWQLHQHGRTNAYAPHQRGIQNLDVQGYLNEKIFVPSYREQQRIGQLLDARYANLQTLTRLRTQQKHLIDARWRALQWTHLLGRETSTTHAPTLDWLTDLPPDWSLLPLSALAEVRAGGMFASSQFGEEGEAVIFLSDVGKGGTPDEHSPRILGAYVPQSARAVRGDVLVALSSRIGFAEVLRVDHAVVNQRVAIVHPHDGVDRYLQRYLCSPIFRRVIERDHGDSSNMPNLSIRSLRKAMIPWPPAATRRRIADRLDAAAPSYERLQTSIALELRLRHERFLGDVMQQLQCTNHPSLP